MVLYIKENMNKELYVVFREQTTFCWYELSDLIFWTRVFSCTLCVPLWVLRSSLRHFQQCRHLSPSLSLDRHSMASVSSLHCKTAHKGSSRIHGTSIWKARAELELELEKETGIEVSWSHTRISLEAWCAYWAIYTYLSVGITVLESSFLSSMSLRPWPFLTFSVPRPLKLPHVDT